ncbi:hypothetical protein CDAR_294911 [Caerostris darwini]|uniref:Uncharacterized protein n=1 Tax=Caerostris darwini TaxID=1538125 RepID=A0AAV4UKT4_9ARAC|nr:hypothetical protein CDAR_294911 [Caerostris darwini]
MPSTTKSNVSMKPCIDSSQSNSLLVVQHQQLRQDVQLRGKIPESCGKMTGMLQDISALSGTIGGERTYSPEDCCAPSKHLGAVLLWVGRRRCIVYLHLWRESFVGLPTGHHPNAHSSNTMADATLLREKSEWPSTVQFGGTVQGCPREGDLSSRIEQGLNQRSLQISPFLAKSTP